jgi:hypothetical protein
LRKPGLTERPTKGLGFYEVYFQSEAVFSSQHLAMSRCPAAEG